MANKNFDFGANWGKFINDINEETVNTAVESLQKSLNLNSFKGMRFLDIGCGSGLFSLAAMKLNAAEVLSFDYSGKSVNAANVLKDKYFKNSVNWKILQASVLDKQFLQTLGLFDIVYSWGVLHHTGDIKQALENAALPVKNNGSLFIAIYNDQGGASCRWKRIKKIYNLLPGFLQTLYVLIIMSFFEFRYALAALLQAKNPFYRFKLTKERGMRVFRDWVDWIGGYPFEVAKPEEIFNFYHNRGFSLEYLKTCGGGMGNNEFIFKKVL
ncbi:MAG: class I SAM-dependent methyltransferase [Elusimicrobiota bacterium]|nr:class I SAM-dependent methyltransferase [Elusimicrobiota bacterium]